MRRIRSADWATAHRAFTVAVATLLVLILVPGSAWSWGRIGHRVSARMAEARLTPAALAAVRHLLGPGVTLADVSLWADSQREVPDSGPWHHLSIP